MDLYALWSKQRGSGGKKPSKCNKCNKSELRIKHKQKEVK